MWPRTPVELEAAQRELAAAAPAPWAPPGEEPAIGACAVCWPRGEPAPGSAGDRGWAAAAVVRDGEPLDHAVVHGRAGAAYAPGLLALREGPLLEAAVRAVRHVPDVLLVDATGRDHPRRAGLALHLGSALAMPTIGVTHRPLLARGEWPPDARGGASPLLLDGEPVGAWLRTRQGARPIAVHAAWRTHVDVAIEVVLRATGRHRTPEPLRAARRLARGARAAA